MTVPHRHRFITHRSERPMTSSSRAVRICTLCSAVQAKESGRWIPIAYASEASRQFAAKVAAERKP